MSTTLHFDCFQTWSFQYLDIQLSMFRNNSAVTMREPYFWHSIASGYRTDHKLSKVHHCNILPDFETIQVQEVLFFFIVLLINKIWLAGVNNRTYYWSLSVPKHSAIYVSQMNKFALEVESLRATSVECAPSVRLTILRPRSKYTGQWFRTYTTMSRSVSRSWSFRWSHNLL